MPYLPDINQTRSMADPAPNWRWVVAMPPLNLNSSSSIGGNSSFPVPYENLMPVSTMPFGLVHRIELQPMQIMSETRTYRGQVKSYPRHTSVPNVNISIYEDINYSVFHYFRSWQNMVIDDQHNYGVPADYKLPLNFFAFDYTSNSFPILMSKLVGCWPTVATGLTYAYDASGPIVLNAELCVDDDQYQFNGSGGSSIFNDFSGGSIGSGNSLNTGYDNNTIV